MLLVLLFVSIKILTATGAEKVTISDTIPAAATAAAAATTSSSSKNNNKNKKTECLKEKTALQKCVSDVMLLPQAAVDQTVAEEGGVAGTTTSRGIPPDELQRRCQAEGGQYTTCLALLQQRPRRRSVETGRPSAEELPEVRFDDPTKLILCVLLLVGWFASYVGCSCTLDETVMLTQHAVPKKKKKKHPASNRNQTKVVLTTTTMTNDTNNNNNTTNTMDPPETMMMEDRHDLPHTGTATGGVVYRRKKTPTRTHDCATRIHANTTTTASSSAGGGSLRGPTSRIRDATTTTTTTNYVPIYKRKYT